MKETRKIMDAEWQVMKVVWECSPVTAGEILESLRLVSKWSPTTIYTLINRLINKKVIAIKEGSSPYIYYPLLSKEECRKEESRSFLAKVYDGSLNLLLACIVREQNLSDREIEELKHILDESRHRKEK